MWREDDQNIATDQKDTRGVMKIFCRRIERGNRSRFSFDTQRELSWSWTNSPTHSIYWVLSGDMDTPKNRFEIADNCGWERSGSWVFGYAIGYRIIIGDEL